MVDSINSSSLGVGPTVTGLQRFDINDQEEFNGGISCSANTQKQIKFGVSVFKEFSNQVKTSYEDIDNKALDLLLSQFYKAARNKKGGFYSITSMQSIRFSLQRYFLESRGIDIMRSEDFYKSKLIFKAMLRKLRVHGKDKVKHYPPITEDDMARMQASLDLSTAQGLQHKVFLDALLYFPNSSTRSLRSMRPGDFVLHLEDSGSFFTLRDSREGQMHALPGNPWCPVANLSKYIAKLNPNCEWMWQRPRQHLGNEASLWYMTAPLGKCTLSNMTKTISESAGCTTGYTNYSLRSTSVTLRNHASYCGHNSEAPMNKYAQNIEKKRKEMLDTLPSTSRIIDVSDTRLGNSKNNLVKFVVFKAAPPNCVLQEIRNTTIVPNAMTKGFSTSISMSPCVTGSTSSTKGIQPYTSREQGNRATANVMGVNKGTMTDLSLVGTLRELSQSKDACTQWEEKVNLKQPSTHSATYTSSIQEPVTPSRGDNGELERDGLYQYPDNTPSVEVDESMHSNEPLNVDSPDDSSVLHIDEGSNGVLEETHMDLSRKGEPSNTPMRRIKEEICEVPEPSDETDYRTFYIKEEYLEDDEREDNNASMQNTPQWSSKPGEDSRQEPTNHGLRSTQHTPGDRAPGQDTQHYLEAKKMYRLQFHLTQGKYKQILDIDSPTTTVSGATIKEAVSSRLQDSVDRLQYFDDDWQEWIDIQPSMNLQGRMRLTVFRTSRELEAPNQARTADDQKLHRLKFHVTLGNSKQVLTVYSTNNTTSGAALKKEVCTTLHCLEDGHSMQFFDDDWQDWVDVKPSMSFRGRTRLNLIRAKVTQPGHILTQ